MTSLIIRLFSGKHYGAEIELNPGTWVFGSDDSCDIILSDPSLARRHAALTISENGATFTVTASALDGQVGTLEPDAPPASELTALTPYRMASVIFAWTKAPAAETDWQGVIESLRIGRRPAEAAAEPTDAPAEQSEQAPTGEQPAESATAEAPVGEATEASPESSADKSAANSSGGISAPALLALGLGCAAIVLAAGLYGISKVTGEPSGGPQEAIQSALAQSGFTDLSVTTIDEDKDDRIDRFLIAGSVANDDQRGQLIRISKMLPYPTTLQVSVDEDITDALKSGFNAQDIWPAVEIRKPDGKDGVKDRILAVSGYIKNEQTESKAFDKALANTPQLLQLKNSPKLLRTIRYERDLQPLVRKSFTARELASTRVLYLPGKIELQLQLTPEREKALAKAIQDLRKASDVPLIIDIKNVDEQTLAKAAASATGAPSAAPVLAAAKPVSAGPAFRVVSTSLGALRFVKLSNGDRVFEGGRLPGGYTLVRIQADKLILSQGGKRIVHPLRVKK